MQEHKIIKKYKKLIHTQKEKIACNLHCLNTTKQSAVFASNLYRNLDCQPSPSIALFH